MGLWGQLVAVEIDYLQPPGLCDIGLDSLGVYTSQIQPRASSGLLHHGMISVRVASQAMRSSMQAVVISFLRCKWPDVSLSATCRFGKAVETLSDGRIAQVSIQDRSVSR